MNTDLIIIREYCTQSRVEPDFVNQLVNEGLIEVYVEDQEYYIHQSQLKRLEQYVRWYYDLSINIEGIDVIQNLLDRMDEMQSEIRRLRELTRLIEE